MIHFEGHDDVHEFLIRMMDRYENEAQADLVRSRYDFQIDQAQIWLEKVQTARDHLKRCMLVDKDHVRVSWRPDDATRSTLIQASMYVGANAMMYEGIRPEVFHRAVSDVERNLKDYLFEPPQPKEQTPPTQP